MRSAFGTGKFSYDPAITQSIFYNLTGGASQVIEPTLLSFSVNVSGQNWGNGGPQNALWWDPSQANSTQEVNGLTQYGPFLSQQWDFGNEITGIPSFFMKGGKLANGQRWGGTWQQQVITNQSPTGGSWVANLLIGPTSVPEPSTTLGISTLGLGFFLLKKKRAAIK